MNNIETMKLALEALETVTKEMLTLRDELAERGGRPQANEFHQRLWDSSHKAYVETAIPTAEALRQAIEQAQQAEPWEKFCDSNCVWTDHHPDCKLAERLPLTDEEMFKIWLSVPAETKDRFAFARAIEAAHGIKEKNT